MSSQTHDSEEPIETTERERNTELVFHVGDNEGQAEDLPTWPQMIVRSEAEELFPEPEIDGQGKEER